MSATARTVLKSRMGTSLPGSTAAPDAFRRLAEQRTKDAVAALGASGTTFAPALKVSFSIQYFATESRLCLFAGTEGGRPRPTGFHLQARQAQEV